jgi:hypothetical protein
MESNTAGMRYEVCVRVNFVSNICEGNSVSFIFRSRKVINFGDFVNFYPDKIIIVFVW